MPDIQPAHRTAPERVPTLVHSPNDRIGPSEANSTPSKPATAQSADGECVRGVRRVVYITLGGTFFVLGMVGIVMPGLPTTPFLLLTSYFLARSWPQMQQRLLANRIVGPILSQWQQHRAVEPRVKKKAVALIGVAMVLLVCFSSMPPALLATVLALTFVGLLVVYRLPTVKDETTRPE